MCSLTRSLGICVLYVEDTNALCLHHKICRGILSPLTLKPQLLPQLGSSRPPFLRSR